MRLWVLGRRAVIGILIFLSLAASRSKPAPRFKPATAPVSFSQPATTQPIPGEAAQARSLRIIKEVFAAEYGLRAPADRQRLARKLLAQGVASEDDSAARFVLLCEARELAASAGDAPTAAAAIQRMSAIYGADAHGDLAAAMGVCIQAAHSPAQLAEIAHICLRAIDGAILGDDFESAGRLCALAQASAERCGQVAMVAASRKTAHEFQGALNERSLAREAQNVLQHRPEEPQANQRIGRYLCFVRNVWSAGLPYLARASEVPLRELARADLAGPAEPSQRLDLANAWWDRAQSQSGLWRRNLRNRAVYWYRLAAPGLSGIQRAMAEKRLEEHERQILSERGIQPGLRAGLFKGIEFAEKAGSRIDERIDFEWGEDAPDQSLAKDNFSIRWNGFLRAAQAGRHDLVVTANTGVRLYVHERIVLDAPNLSRQRNGARIVLDLPEGLHPLRIDYWDTSGLARMRLLWRPPGATKDVVVPGSALFHDELQSEPRTDTNLHE